jgi:hypothetical protein
MGRVSMPQGKGSQLHNRRGYESIGRAIPEHIDQKRTHENVTLVDIPIKQAYDELFGEALAAYNAKQRRSDRKIASYYEHVKGLKTGEKLFYEDVVQWGSKDDFTNEKTRQNAKECLIEYVKGFEERNPNLKLIGAYIHMDEASPHLHLDYIPHAHGYKRGLSVRNSFSKALHEMGFEQDPETRKDNAAVQWKKHERAVFGDICAAHGLEVEEERAARGSLSVDEYKAVKDQMIGDIEQAIEPLRELKIDIDEIADTGKTILPGVVAVNKKDLEVMKEQAKAYIANRNEIGELRDRTAAVSQREQHADQREQELDQKNAVIREKAQYLLEAYDRQGHLNELLEKAEKDGMQKDKQIASLKAENNSLKEQICILKEQLESVKENLTQRITNLTDKLKGAYQSLAAVVKAVRMLKYDDRDGYKVEGLNKKQDRLIDGLAEYGAKWAKEDGYKDIAEDMEKHIGISQGIEKTIAPQRSRSRDDEMGL